MDLIKTRRVALVINVPDGTRKSLEVMSPGYLLRRTTVSRMFVYHYWGPTT